MQTTDYKTTPVRQKPLKLVKNAPLYVMISFGMIYLLINNYLPMVGLIIAFKDINFSKGIWGSKWVGFKNFEYLFKTADAWIITRNTILYNLAFIVITLVLAVLIAILLSELKSKLLSRFYQTSILLPYVISYVVVSYLVFAFLSNDGMMNKSVLPLFGMEPINWYLKDQYWPFIIIVTNTWKSVGYSCVIYLATIMSFDSSYYEAASLDGANKLQQIFRITIPLLQPTIITMTLLAIGRIFYSDFALFYQVPQNSGALFNTTNVIDTYVYRGLLELGNVSMSSAAGLYQAIVGFVIVLVSNMVVRKYSKENAMF